jgi:hypothetical protein
LEEKEEEEEADEDDVVDDDDANEDDDASIILFSDLSALIRFEDLDVDVDTNGLFSIVDA